MNREHFLNPVASRTAASSWLALACALAGCQNQTPPGLSAKAQRPSPPAATAPAPQTKIAPSLPRPLPTARETHQPAQPATLADLATLAAASEFDAPQLDEGKIRAAGIRRLDGRQITLYTDLPPAPGVDELPQAFDAAVPLWSAYFGVEPAKVQSWKVIASVIKDRERFIGAGLYPERLPDFPHGYTLGSQLFLYDQPSDYFRRHLLLHEGTHAFMLRWLDGAGPPWYMEGMAELLGTHHWADGQLTLGVMPKTKEEVPYWGRVKIIKDAYKAGEPLSLIEIMRYDAQAHIRVEAYGWCWAAAAFLDAHPKTQIAFRGLKSRAHYRSLEFSKQFYEAVKHDWPAIVEDWQIFVAECDYGYDFARAAVQRKPPAALPENGVEVVISAVRGWQSTGYRLEPGHAYTVEARGRYQLKSDPAPWRCEPGGVTLRYANGHPLGMLMGALGDLETDSPTYSPLVSPTPLGLSAELAPGSAGTLYLKINEPASSLSDNSGTLTVIIREKERGPRNSPGPSANSK